MSAKRDIKQEIKKVNKPARNTDRGVQPGPAGD